jgi:hypothetical protein
VLDLLRNKVQQIEIKKQNGACTYRYGREELKPAGTLCTRGYFRKRKELKLLCTYILCTHRPQEKGAAYTSLPPYN